MLKMDTDGRRLGHVGVADGVAHVLVQALVLDGARQAEIAAAAAADVVVRVENVRHDAARDLVVHEALGPLRDVHAVARVRGPAESCNQVTCQKKKAYESQATGGLLRANAQ